MIQPTAIVGGTGGVVRIDDDTVLRVADDGISVEPGFYRRLASGLLTPEAAVDLAAALEMAAELADRPA